MHLLTDEETDKAVLPAKKIVAENIAASCFETPN